MFDDDTGHGALLTDGYAYDFKAGPVYYGAQAAQRSVLRAFQTYPRNLVQGAGRLVMGAYNADNLPCAGSAFRETQPPQLVQLFDSINADILGGGVLYNGIAFQPLVESYE